MAVPPGGQTAQVDALRGRFSGRISGQRSPCHGAKSCLQIRLMGHTFFLGYRFLGQNWLTLGLVPQDFTIIEKIQAWPNQ